MPEFAEKLRQPEPMDSEPGVVVLLAESKLDGAPLGTLRIQSNAHMPLKVEQSVTLPRWLRDRPLAEVSRLGIVGGTTGRLVKTVLLKAAFQYCEQDGIEWAIVAARAPLDRHYDQLMFEDLFPEQGFIPMRHGNNIPAPRHGLRDRHRPPALERGQPPAAELLQLHASPGHRHPAGPRHAVGAGCFPRRRAGSRQAVSAPTCLKFATVGQASGVVPAPIGRRAVD
jgi:hypothetical protein